MDMNKLMKQAQEMQKQLMREQKEMANKTFEATSGGGMVTAKVNGTGTLLGLTIDPTVVDKTDVEMLQDLVVAAVNEANKQASDSARGNMSGMMSQLGMSLPGE